MIPRIPFVDLSYLTHGELGQKTEQIIHNVLETHEFILGSEAAAFEVDFAQYCGVPFSVGVGSGLDAIRFTLIASGVQQGDSVILPALTFVATAFAVTQVGAKPLLVDVDPTTGLLDCEKVFRLLRTSPKSAQAIIPVYLYGQMVNMSDVMDLASRFDLKVIEDACQAHGADWRGEKSGTWGHAGCFSFYPSKNLGAIGDGGIITTKSEQIAHHVSLLRSYGESTKGVHEVIGWNSRLDALQAAILRLRLKHLDRWNKERRIVAQHYRKVLSHLKPIVALLEEISASHVYHLFVIRSKYRDELRSWLDDRGIETGIHYRFPIHLQPAYQGFSFSKLSFPNAELFSKEVLSLPLYPGISEESIQRVTEGVCSFCESHP